MVVLYHVVIHSFRNPVGPLHYVLVYITDKGSLTKAIVPVTKERDIEDGCLQHACSNGEKLTESKIVMTVLSSLGQEYAPLLTSLSPNLIT